MQIPGPRPQTDQDLNLQRHKIHLILAQVILRAPLVTCAEGKLLALLGASY